MKCAMALHHNNGIESYILGYVESFDILESVDGQIDLKGIL